MNVQKRTVGGGQVHVPPPPDNKGALPSPGFWYSLFLVLNGMTFEGKMRKFRIKFVLGGRIFSNGGGSKFCYPFLANLSLRPCEYIYIMLKGILTNFQIFIVDFADSAEYLV